MKSVVVAAVVTLSLFSASAQEPPVAFEVASIEQNKDGGRGGIRPAPGGRFDVTNTSLARLITWAYQLQAFDLVGGPSWVMNDRWNVVAKYPGDPPRTAPGTPDALMLATRALMANRFKLLLRPETRDVDVYQLVLARADKQPGPGLRRSPVDCVAVQKALDDVRRGGPPASSPNTPDRVVCGLRFSGRRLQIGGMPVSELINVLVMATERRVVDRTGLTGDWELDITFRPEDPRLPAEPGDGELPSVFTVLQEQLGLKLESARMPQPVMVVERVERPVED